MVVKIAPSHEQLMRYFTFDRKYCPKIYRVSRKFIKKRPRTNGEVYMPMPLAFLTNIARTTFIVSAYRFPDIKNTPCASVVSLDSRESWLLSQSSAFVLFEGNEKWVLKARKFPIFLARLPSFYLSSLSAPLAAFYTQTVFSYNTQYTARNSEQNRPEKCCICT